jgi:hypothetical protein
MRQTMLILCDCLTDELNVKGSNLDKEAQAHSRIDISVQYMAFPVNSVSIFFSFHVVCLLLTSFPRHSHSSNLSLSPCFLVQHLFTFVCFSSLVLASTAPSRLLTTAVSILQTEQRTNMPNGRNFGRVTYKD